MTHMLTHCKKAAISLVESQHGNQLSQGSSAITLYWLSRFLGEDTESNFSVITCTCHSAILSNLFPHTILTGWSGIEVREKLVYMPWWGAVYQVFRLLMA